MPGNYRIVGGKAHAPEWVAGAVKKTIGEGRYKLPGYEPELPPLEPELPALPAVPPAPSLTALQTPTPPQVPYQEQLADILGQLRERVEAPFRPEDYPGYEALRELAEREAQQASLRALEELNARGVLGSTMAAEAVAQAQQDAMLRMMPVILERAYGMRQDEIANLMNLLEAYRGLGAEEYARQWQAAQWTYEQQLQAALRAVEMEQARVRAAWDRVKMLGYVDNEASVVLGLPVGTPSFQARKAAEDRMHELEMQKRAMQHEAGLARMKEEAATQGAAIRAATRGARGGGTAAPIEERRLPATARERSNLATATMVRAAANRYDELRSKNYQYPLYYTVSSFLRDSVWKRLAAQTGADLKYVVDSVIIHKGKMTPEQYFNTRTGKKLKKYYDALFGTEKAEEPARKFTKEDYIRLMEQGITEEDLKRLGISMMTGT